MIFRFWKATAPHIRRVGSVYHRSSSVVSFNHDGLEIARTKSHRGGWLPLWHLMIFVYLVLLIRLVAVADIGPAGYANRMEEMKNGSILERSAARVMELDPMSRKVAIELRQVIKYLASF